MPKPQYHLPRQFDSAMLLKQAIPGETIVVLQYKDAYNQSAFQFSDKNGRVGIFHFDAKLNCHALRVPEHLWNADRGAMAHAFMQTGSSNRLVVTTKTPKAVATDPNAANITNLRLLACDNGPHQGIGVEFKFNGEYFRKAFQTLGAVTSQDIINLDRLIQESLKSQVGEAANSPDSYSGTVGSSPTPATTYPETGATDQGQDALNVVGRGAPDASTVAPSSVTLTGSFAAEQEDRKALTAELNAGIINDAWLAVEKPVRLKALAALLKVDEQTLKDAIALPLSTVELGHAGWVKRREPQA